MVVYKVLAVLALGVSAGLVFPLLLYRRQCRGAQYKMTGQQLDYIPHGGPCPGPYGEQRQEPEVGGTHAWVEIDGDT